MRGTKQGIRTCDGAPHNLRSDGPHRRHRYLAALPYFRDTAAALRQRVRETRTKDTCACVQMSKIGALELYVTGSIADDQLRGSLQAKSGGDVKYLPKFDVGHIGLSSPAMNPSWFQGLLRACSRKSMTHSFSALERNIPTAKNIAFAIHHLHFAQICYK